MITDWDGDRFVTSHRCFGGRCKGDLPSDSLVQLDQEKNQKWTYGHADAERDAAAFYPGSMEATPGELAWIHGSIDALTGRYLTPYERIMRSHADQEKRLDEAS